MEMRLAVTYTPYSTSSKEQTSDVITFAQFEEGNILNETRNNTESGDESDSESIMMSEKDMEDLDETEKFDVVYVPSTRKVISSYDFRFDKSFFQCTVIYVTTVC